MKKTKKEKRKVEMSVEAKARMKIISIVLFFISIVIINLPLYVVSLEELLPNVVLYRGASLGLDFLILVVVGFSAIKRSYYTWSPRLRSTLFFTLFVLSFFLIVIAGLLFTGFIPGTPTDGVVGFVVGIVLMLLAMGGYSSTTHHHKKSTFVPLAKNLPSRASLGIDHFDTEFDILYKIVEKTQRVKISVVAKYFGLKPKVIEEWAHIMEEHSLMRIHYPPFGSPELRKWKN